MQKELEVALSCIRPILQQDGGDIEIVEMTEDRIVKVRLLGQCDGCPKSGQTLKNIITKTFVKMVPGIRKVEAVN